MGRLKWSDEQVKFIFKRRSEMMEIEGMTDRTELVEEFFQKFGYLLKVSQLDNAFQRYRNYELADDTAISNIKKARSAQLSRAKIGKENRIILDSEMVKETFLSKFEQLITDTPMHIHAPLKTKPRKTKFDRVVVGHISDTHIGADIDPEEMGDINSYSVLQEARRHAFYFKQLAEYKTRYRKETQLVLFLNGDLMQGVIHDQEDAAEMTTQFARALNIYVQGISYVAQHYKSVRVICTAGNHARFMHKSNKGRVSSKKWDGFHTMLSIGIRASLSAYKNIEVEIPITPYASVDVLGHHFFAAHGDTVINVGNVSKTISMSNIANQVNDINSALDKKVSVLLVGHVHKATYQTLDNGTEVVINGCLSGTDSFAQSIGILHNHPCQQMFECTPDHAVGDMRFVRLKCADDDGSLDEIIKPLFKKF